MNPRTTVAVALALAALLALPAMAEAAPKRIVALTPFTANTLVSLGIKPVAIGQTLGGKERLSRRLRRTRTLPLSHPNGPNLEQLAALDPQLVISSPTWRKGTPAMRRLKMRVVESDPHSARELLGQTRRLGVIVGRRKAARKVAKRIEKRIKRAQRGIRSRPTVLVILGVGRTPFAFLPATWGGDLVRRAGGRLLTEGLSARGGFARISDETVVARNPDVIIGVPHANTKDVPAIERHMKTNPAWQSTNAAKDGRIYVSTDNSLLQAGTDVDKTILRVRGYLRNR